MSFSTKFHLWHVKPGVAILTQLSLEKNCCPIFLKCAPYPDWKRRGKREKIRKKKQIARTAMSPSHPGVLHDPLILPDFSTSSQLLGSCVKMNKMKSAIRGNPTEIDNSICQPLSPPQRLLLVNTSESIKRWREKTGAFPARFNFSLFPASVHFYPARL